MDDLVAFLRARLDEDEAVARGAQDSAGEAQWQLLPGWRGVAASGPLGTMTLVGSGDELEPTIGAHIARHDPARVLREVEAKRELLDEYARVAVNDSPQGGYEYATGWANGLGLVVRYAAAVYADHPDYRPEWAPTA